MRRSRLSPVSARRSDMRVEYERAKMKAWERDRGQCQAAKIWPEVVCAGRKDPHHIRPQGMYPELRADPDNLIVLCRAHHQAVHLQEPVKARELGLLI